MTSLGFHLARSVACAVPKLARTLSSSSSPNPSILVTGAGHQVGKYILNTALCSGVRATVLTTERGKLDEFSHFVESEALVKTPYDMSNLDGREEFASLMATAPGVDAVFHTFQPFSRCVSDYSFRDYKWSEKDRERVMNHFVNDALLTYSVNSNGGERGHFLFNFHGDRTNSLQSRRYAQSLCILSRQIRFFAGQGVSATVVHLGPMSDGTGGNPYATLKASEVARRVLDMAYSDEPLPEEIVWASARDLSSSHHSLPGVQTS